MAALTQRLTTPVYFVTFDSHGQPCKVLDVEREDLLLCLQLTGMDRFSADPTLIVDITDLHGAGPGLPFHLKHFSQLTPGHTYMFYGGKRTPSQGVDRFFPLLFCSLSYCSLSRSLTWQLSTLSCSPGRRPSLSRPRAPSMPLPATAPMDMLEGAQMSRTLVRFRVCLVL